MLKFADYLWMTDSHPGIWKYNKYKKYKNGDDMNSEYDKIYAERLIHQMLRYFEYKHLPLHLQKVSRQFYDLAQSLERSVMSGQEKTEGFRKLIEAKDCFVRAELDRSDGQDATSVVNARGNPVPVTYEIRDSTKDLFIVKGKDIIQLPRKVEAFVILETCPINDKFGLPQPWAKVAEGHWEQLPENSTNVSGDYFIVGTRSVISKDTFETLYVKKG